MEDKLEARIVRGAESWSFFWIVTSVAIGYEAAVASLLPRPWAVGIVFMVMPLSAIAILTNGWLQNKLMMLKVGLEEKAR